MKQKGILLLSAVFFMLSCTNDIDENQCESTMSAISTNVKTRSIVEDSIMIEEPTILVESEELEHLKSLLREKQKPRRMKVISPEYEIDEFFSTNMYAIRELPLTIKVRATASGSSATNTYLFCPDKGKEVTLSASSTLPGSKFFIKMVPPSTGIQYMLYSNAAQTPLAVGQYNSNPDNKILMATKSEPTSTFGVGWDFLPSTYKGYFAIQSSSYLGQSDPNNAWSVFYYVLEAKANNKLGYAQRVSNKAQQEFLIIPDNDFTLIDMSFDLDNAVISEGEMVTTVKSVTNPTDFIKTEPIIVEVPFKETSCFNETGGALKLNIFSGRKQIVRPIPVAGKAIIPEGINGDASYSSTTSTFNVSRADTTSIQMKPQSLLQLTAKFRTYTLAIPYVATAKCRVRGPERLVKVKGIWRGNAIANPKYNKPIYEPRFYDLESGEKLNYSLVYNTNRNLYIVK